MKTSRYGEGMWRATQGVLWIALILSFNLTAAAQWTKVAGVSNVCALASSADGQKLVAASKNIPIDILWVDLIWTSSDWGVNWVSNRTAFYEFISFACSADGGRLAMIESSLGEPTAWTWVGISADLGRSWLAWHALTNECWWRVCVACSADGSHMAASGAGDVGFGWPSGLFVSSDAGMTWERTGSPVGGASGVAVSADGRYMAAASGDEGYGVRGPIYRSSDWGATWDVSGASLQIWEAIAGSADGRRLVAATQDGIVACSTNRGATWTQNKITNAVWCVTSSADGTKLAAGSSLIYVSTNAGASWVASDAPAKGWVNLISTADGSKMAAVTSGGELYTWQTTPEPVLSIRLSSNDLVLSWIVPSAALVLQECTDLAGPGWTDVRIQPALNYSNLQNQVIVPLGAEKKFYRLRGS